jgi:hypothetical protein
MESYKCWYISWNRDKSMPPEKLKYGVVYVDKYRCEIQEQKEVPVWWPNSSTA